MGNTESIPTTYSFTQEQIDQRRKELGLDDSMKDYIPATRDHFTMEITSQSEEDKIKQIENCLNRLEAQITKLEKTVNN